MSLLAIFLPLLTRPGMRPYTETSWPQIASHLRGINPYITFLKSINDRLANEENLQGYKLLHENPRHHDPRTYNRPTSDEVAIAWEGDVEDPLGLPEAKDILIESRTGERFSVPYWHPAYMPLRYPLIFPFGEQSWHRNIPLRGNPLGGSLRAQRDLPRQPIALRVAANTGRGGSTRVTLASYYRYLASNRLILLAADLL